MGRPDRHHPPPAAPLTAWDGPTTLQLPLPRRTRDERTVAMLRAARAALGEALDELERRHPTDGDLLRQLAAWRWAGGVPFRS